MNNNILSVKHIDLQEEDKIYCPMCEDWHGQHSFCQMPLGLNNNLWTGVI